MSLGQAALKWILAEPRVVTTLPNIYDDAQLAEFAEASDKADLDAGQMDRELSAQANFGVEEDAMNYKGTMERVLRESMARLTGRNASAGASHGGDRDSAWQPQ